MDLKRLITKISFGILCLVSSALAQTLDAGRTTGALDVSPTGAATYSVPIAVPPGINGVTPQIALTYNSQSGNGMAGYGWNVSGLSSISRIPRTRFHNDFVGGVNVDMNDRFAIDGQRLMLKTGTYGAEGAVYETENYSNIQIFSHGTTGSGPEYFDVYYPDGSHAVYGYHPDSKAPDAWGLNYVDNALGIRITYNYTNVEKILTLTQVSYGAKGTGAPLNFVYFNYKTRQRKEQSFVGGQSVYLDKILDNIRVVGNGVDYRHYKLTYDVSTMLNYERLKEIKEVSGDQSRAFAPIIFNYNDTGWNTTPGPNATVGLTGISSNNNSVVTADFNGNGQMDVVLYNRLFGGRTHVWVYSDPKSGGTYSAPPQVSTGAGLFTEIFAVSTLTPDNKLRNGQGLLLIKENGISVVNFETFAQGSGAPLALDYTKSWNAPTMPPYYSEFTGGDIQPSEAIHKRYLSGDFNGDGLTDVVAINEPFTYTSYEHKVGTAEPYTSEKDYAQIISASFYFINLDRRVTSDYVHSMGSIFNFSLIDKLEVGDFNGDGKSDILHVKDGAAYVYQLDAANHLELLWSATDSRIKPSQVLLGDYNGDGKTDAMLHISSSYYEHFVLMSSGTGFFGYQRSYPFDRSLASFDGILRQTTLIPNDINNDGKTDIIKFVTLSDDSNPAVSTRVILEIYNNMGPSSTTSLAPAFSGNEVFSSPGVHVKDYPIPLFLSSDQPNFNLELGLLSDNTITPFTHPKNLRKETEIVSVNHDGVMQYIDYQPLLTPASAPPGLTVYTGMSNYTFPYINIWGTPGLNVVGTLRRNFDGNELKQAFGYRKGVSHADGLGFIGFEKTIRSSWYENDGDANIIYTVNVSDPQNRGATLRTFTTRNKNLENSAIAAIPGETPDIAYSTPVTTSATASNSITILPGASIYGTTGSVSLNISDPATGIADGATINDYISRTDYTYKTELRSNKVYVNVPLSATTKNLLDGTNTLTLSKYDGYYNVTEQTTNLSGMGIETVQTTYDNNPIGVYIGRVTNQKSISQNSGDTYSTEVQYTYTGYTPTQIKRKGNGTPFITENLVYDTYGNITSKQIVTADGTRTELTEFDSFTGRFVTKRTNVEGLATNYTYNATTGNLATQTNPYAQVTNYTYDAWGRPVQTTDYLGNYATKSYQRSGANLIVTEADNQGREKKTTSNAIGKTLEVTEKDVLGQIVGRQYRYDKYDRLEKVSEPAIGAPTQWTVSVYDNYSRITTVTSPNGKVTTTNYPTGLITTVSDGTKTVTTTKNALGYVVTIQDLGGTISNTYYANGKLRSAGMTGSTQTITYDGWGRKTQMVDPTAGTYTYSYNQFGQALTEITPKGTTTYTYAASTGKPDTKTVVGDNTNMSYSYFYDPTTKLPTSTVLTDTYGNTTYTYTYDSNKRPATVEENNPYAIFKKTFTYDSYSRLSTEKSDATNKSNNVTVSKTILNVYQNGERKTIVDNGTGLNVWSISSLNARGQVTMAQLGANLRETNQYDAHGFPTEIKTERMTPSVTELMKLTYSFDVQRGNLNSRTNTAFGWNESFYYDNLDRLVTFTDNNGTQTQTYDDPGRILTNSKVGSYNYTGSSYRLDNITNLTPFAKYHFQNDPLQTITYNAFKSPVEIIETGKELISFQYNGAQARAHMHYGGMQGSPMARPLHRHYSEDGSMEITENTTTGKTGFVFYMGGDAYDAPAIWKHEQTSSTTTAGLFYLHRDYQGSILMITDISGTIKEKRHFDAWGNIVKLTDGIGTNLTAFVVLDRGYTGHEHLLAVGLINMNARLYDPLLHRFLAPDNFVQDPTNTQNFNRYGYVMNNPLKFTDESGEFWQFVIGAAIGVFTNGINNAIHDRPFFQGAGQAAFLGAVQGGFSNAIGNLAGNGLGGAAFQAVAHSTLGGMMSVANGGSFGPGFLSGLTSSVVGSALSGPLSNASAGWAAAGMYGSGMLAGGLSSAIAGGSFWDGARNGAITTGLNHLLHSIPQKGGDYLVYDGDEIVWYNGKGEVIKRFPASSGYKLYQNSMWTAVAEKGPVPEGSYTVDLSLDPNRVVRGNSDGSTKPGVGIQTLPARFTTPSGTTYDWLSSWGTTRAALTPSSGTNIFGRHSFYLHNSHKGFSHGCIEVGRGFFTELLNYAKTHSSIRVIVDYPTRNSPTIGNTKY